MMALGKQFAVGHSSSRYENVQFSVVLYAFFDVVDDVIRATFKSMNMSVYIVDGANNMDFLYRD